MQKAKRSNITILAILTTLTLLTWVFVEAYQRFNLLEVTNIPPAILAPLNPTLDEDALNLLKGREHFTDEEINRFLPKSSQTQASPATAATQVNDLESSPSGGL